MKREPVAQFDDVVKVYTRGVFPRMKLRALAGVSFAVPAGSVFGLVGPNRAGKTTLVKILLSLCKPTSGRVLRLGQPTSFRRTLGRVGYVHESQAFPAYWSAWELLDFYGALTRLPTHVRRLRGAELLERVGLDDRADEPIATFSKGMLQRLALAQALLNDPDLLVLDEPAEGLDLTARRMFRAVVDERRRQGHSVLLVSHSLGEVERCCDHVAVLRSGTLAFCGGMDQLKAEQPQAGELEQALAPMYEEAAV
jgi:ABC-2 type transport system ATP-binding protein